MTRIFIFRKVSDIDDKSLAAIKKQAACKINIFVLIVEGNDIFQPDSGREPNFALIDDGQIISVARIRPDGRFSGSFYFQETQKINNYLNFIKEMQTAGHKWQSIEDLNKYKQRFEKGS